MGKISDREHQLLKNVELIPFSDCWYWTAKKNKKGYGHVTINYKTCHTHRVSYSYWVGPIPDGMHVLHTCDNPSCINPHHLRLGTNQDNINDKVSKNRQRGRYPRRNIK